MSPVLLLRLKLMQKLPIGVSLVLPYSPLQCQGDRQYKRWLTPYLPCTAPLNDLFTPWIPFPAYSLFMWTAPNGDWSFPIFHLHSFWFAGSSGGLTTGINASRAVNCDRYCLLVCSLSMWSTGLTQLSWWDINKLLGYFSESLSTVCHWLQYPSILAVFTLVMHQAIWTKESTKNIFLQISPWKRQKGKSQFAQNSQIAMKTYKSSTQCISYAQLLSGTNGIFKVLKHLMFAYSCTLI